MAPSTEKRSRSEGRGVQSIEMGSRLLAALVDEVEPMMLKDLAKVAGFAPAQAHAYLVSYRKIGFVEQDAATGRYRLGRFALDVGTTAVRTLDPMQLATEAARDLSERTGLHVALVVWGSFGPTVIQVQESGSQINMNTRPGTVYSMTGTASGRVFCAWLPEATVREHTALEKREKAGSGRVGTHRFMSRKEIDTIRENGWGTVDDAPVPGVHAYSAPVFDLAGQLALVMTIIGQDYYIEERLQQEYLPALLESTRALSQELGYAPTH